MNLSLSYPANRAVLVGLVLAVCALPTSGQSPASPPAPPLQPPADSPPPSSPVPTPPVILTPKPAATPRLTGPQVFGVRPGAPFLFTLTATGDRPLTFSADNLPPGIVLDPTTGRLTGLAPTGPFKAPPNFAVTVRAKNALGTATRGLRIIIGEQIALTPPMGWNSWNSWAGNVDADKVLKSAHALIATGLINHGWSYINIDDTWQGERTGPDHALLANQKFPDMKALVDEIHSLGLKAGLYSTPWITSYANYAGGSAANPEGMGGRGGGNANHHIGEFHFMAADARQYAAWGFDYLKYDWDSQKVTDIQEMSGSLRASGRDIIYSLSNSLPRNEGADLVKLANVWRTTGDINDQWGRQPDYHHGIAEIGFGQDAWAQYSGPGHWVDPDMLVLGRVSVGMAMHNTRLTPDEQYTHISLWSLLAAPLLIGCDMERIDEFTLSLLTNDEVLDVDQDVLGKQAVRVAGSALTLPPAQRGGRGRRGGAFGGGPPGTAPTPPAPATAAPAVPPDNPVGNGLVLARPLADGSLAVGLFNVGPKEETVAVTWQDLGVTGQRIVRDLWRQKDLGAFGDKFAAAVPSHGVVLVKLSPVK